ncbi:hypothetical protein [Congregibacter litoralis]|uniref:Uncharacterized protein n=1 Tax=Congregibacter litoralis KT71 TaxID=314285 RepID=A4A5P6_9GAMM|nr:hypothetical protein [Congregibacter litoralis]EAQ98343.1 hypothetical protein KT71_00160 [Congregibacter litoralis KT71]
MKATIKAALSIATFSLATAVGTTAGAEEFVKHGVTVQQVVAKQLASTQVVKSGFIWDQATPYTSAKVVRASEVNAPGFRWEASQAESAMASVDYSGSAVSEPQGYIWGIRNAADQQGYIWGIRNAADQQGYIWGIRNAADQKGYIWGIRNAADQQGYIWGIRNAADQQGYIWGIRNAADQQGYIWGIRNAADQQGYIWGIRNAADQKGYIWGIR